MSLQRKLSLEVELELTPSRFAELCRDTSDRDPQRKRQDEDEVRDANGQLVLGRDLGHFDCFNYPLRIDGGDALYFLRGTPATSHEGKVLCRIDDAGDAHECWPWTPPSAT